MQVFEYYFSVAYIPLCFNRNRKWFVKKHIIAHFWYPWYRSFCNVVQIHIFIIDCNSAPHWILISPSLSEANQPHIPFKTKSLNSFNNKDSLKSLPHLLTTKIFFIFLVPFPYFDAIHCNWEEIYFLSPQLNSVLCRTAFGEAAPWSGASGERAKKAW